MSDLAPSTSTFNAEASTSSTPPLLAPEPVSLSEKKTVADKWLKPNGPPVGATFGARLLKDEDDVFNHNAWDHVTLPEDFKEKAEEIMELHRSSPVSENLREEYNGRPAHYWNKFYSQHEAGFFKDRGWLRLEFPELVACSEPDAGPKVVLEVGCGAGNTVFPLLLRNENPELVVHATDYSSTAVKVVKSNPMYPRPDHGKGILHASVWDITSKPSSTTSDAEPVPQAQHTSETSSSSILASVSSAASTLIEQAASALSLSNTTVASAPTETPTYSLPEGITPNSVDVISVIFVLSALHPKEWDQAIHNLYTALKPGGLLLIRDYGRHDLAQLRIRKNRLLDPKTPNLYIRGDGTRVYFFEKEEMEKILTATPRGEDDEKKMFGVEQLGEDRRLLVNRKERKQMYRIWLQVKARKLA
ncbi:hypothetical protein CI109_106156 [Kwoniella shandongensis]|uniref:tRNA N(3)-methylcytidine methyltransferase n=1 Tax=Kwoniella shandongensis TaxID=1734106 RepID=A0A5M6BYL2_9TREE|nr:uncharacterized protein CI109_003764 [Kwoniella shandongensis]KAA5527793.1 hypothetical protein CI109_003764 [Kwoniella shandongensis]